MSHLSPSLLSLQVRHLVTETKHLEFINVGWCMNDEASTDCNAISDQMSIGLLFVEENLVLKLVRELVGILTPLDTRQSKLHCLQRYS